MDVSPYASLTEHNAPPPPPQLRLQSRHRLTRRRRLRDNEMSLFALAQQIAYFPFAFSLVALVVFFCGLVWVAPTYEQAHPSLGIDTAMIGHHSDEGSR